MAIPRRRRRHPRAGWALLIVPALLLMSFGLVLTMAGHDTVAVRSRATLADVSFGRPWPWIHQDLTRLAPPLPYAETIGSPTENPTSITLGPLLADLGVTLMGATAALLTLWWLALAAWHPFAELVRRNEAWVKRRSDEARADAAGT